MTTFPIGVSEPQCRTDWEPHESNPVLTSLWVVGTGWRQCPADRARHYNSRYVMAYQGYVSDGFTWSIGVGVAESEDGVRWTRSDANPVLDRRSNTMGADVALRAVRGRRRWHHGLLGNEMAVRSTCTPRSCRRIYRIGTSWPNRCWSRGRRRTTKPESPMHR